MARNRFQNYALTSLFIVTLFRKVSSNNYLKQNETFSYEQIVTHSVPLSKSPYDIVPSVSVSDDNTFSNSTDVYDDDLHHDTSLHTTYNDSYQDYEPYEYDEFVYSGFSFERPVYLYIWEILVIVLFLVNIIVISVLLRSKMRNATNMILSAIAISDTLTGLVTLPTYIMVYSHYDTDQQYEKHHSNHTEHQYDDYHNNANATSYYDDSQSFSEQGYILSKELCNGFMLSKYFLSKMFHTVSIFLTLFLGIQRYTSVAFPFKSQRLFSVRNTVIFCIVIFFASPTLHLYHVTADKAVDGLCQWELREDGCGGDCVYLWILFFVRHFIPCVCLTIFTALFINHLRRGTRKLQKMDNNFSQIMKRKEENRRISTIVIGIVVVFLIPEIPFGIFLLYSAIEKTVSNGENFNLEVNRGIHMGYEILLLLSFNANFYIYTFFNKRFRKCLKKTYLYPIIRLVGDTDMFSISKTSSLSKKSTRKTDCGSSQGGMEMKSMQNSSSDKSVTMLTKVQ